jgi:hypothetical protein
MSRVKLQPAIQNDLATGTKNPPRSFRAGQIHATKTTFSDEMQLVESITATQALFHGENPNPSNPEGFGTPHGSRELSSELVVWYHPPGRHVNAKNNKKGSATRRTSGWPDVWNAGHRSRRFRFRVYEWHRKETAQLAYRLHLLI